MSVRTIRFCSLCAALIGGLLGGPNASAEALRNAPPGAFGWGQPGGKIAYVDDASAVFINPANIADLQTPQVLFAPSVVYLDANFEAPDGRRASSKSPWKLVPAFFATSPIGDTGLVAGLGVTAPYGQSVIFDQDFTFKYLAPHFSELLVLDISPTLAFKVNDQLSVGVGADLIWSQMEFRQSYPWALLTGGPAPDGNMSFNGDDWATGWNAGLTWKMSERYRLAATYRSAFRARYAGDFKIDNMPAIAAAIGATPTSAFSSSIKFPSIFTIGLGIQVTDTFRVGLDVESVKWSNMQALDLNIGNNSALLPSTTLPAGWVDTHTYGIGWNWRFRPEWTLRGGWWYLENPIPTQTQQPNLSESDQHAITLGIGYRHGRQALDFSYGYVLYKDRNVTDNLVPEFNGSYDKNVHIVSLSWTLQLQ